VLSRLGWVFITASLAYPACTLRDVAAPLAYPAGTRIIWTICLPSGTHVHPWGLTESNASCSCCTVRVFLQKFTLEDAIGSHACLLQANMRVTNGIPLGCPLLLPVGTVNWVQTLKVRACCKLPRTRLVLFNRTAVVVFGHGQPTLAG